MKQNKPLQKLAAAAIVVLLTAACTQGEAEPGTDPTPRPLQITTVKVETTTATRAVTTTDYPLAKAIGFIIKEDADRGYAALNNWKGTYNATRMLWLPDNPAAGTTEDADSIWLNNNEAEIAIYAPYDATQPTDGTLNLTACVRLDNTKDIWCKVLKASNANPMQAPVLEHLYTRIRFTVTRSAEYTATATITAIELAGKEVYPTAVYSPFADTPYGNDGATQKFAPTVATQTLPLNAPTATATYDLLLIPATLTENITLTLTVNGVPMKGTIDKTKFTGSKLEPGKMYNTSLLLKPGVLEFGEVTVVKWDNSLPPVDGGQGEFDQPDVPIIGGDAQTGEWGNDTPAGSGDIEL